MLTVETAMVGKVVKFMKTNTFFSQHQIYFHRSVAQDSGVNEVSRCRATGSRFNRSQLRHKIIPRGKKPRLVLIGQSKTPRLMSGNGYLVMMICLSYPGWTHPKISVRISYYRCLARDPGPPDPDLHMKLSPTMTHSKCWKKNIKIKSLLWNTVKFKKSNQSITST